MAKKTRITSATTTATTATMASRLGPRVVHSADALRRPGSPSRSATR